MKVNYNNYKQIQESIIEKINNLQLQGLFLIDAMKLVLLYLNQDIMLVIHEFLQR